MSNMAVKNPLLRLDIARSLCHFPSQSRTPFPCQANRFTRLNASSLSLLVAEDVGVTGIQDGHGTTAEELTAGGAELNLRAET
jgi:hypothetical protein